MKITEIYQSNEPNTNPNCNGTPPILTLVDDGVNVRMTVTGEQGCSINGMGSVITLSDVTVPKVSFDHFKSSIISGATFVKRYEN